MDDTAHLAEQLRSTIGHLVRVTRATDTMPEGEAALLGYLDRDGPATTAELAQRRVIRHQTAARTVKELRAAGLVATTPHKSDGRKIVLSLTPTGKTRLDEERNQRADCLNAAIHNELNTTEREELARCITLLKRIATSIQRDQQG